MPSQHGKTAVVTGGSQGIGAGIVRKFANEGANVVFSYLSNGEAADRLAGELKSAGGSVVAIRADVTQPDDVTALFEAARNAFGVVDTLVNNAGVFTLGPVTALDYDEVHRMFATNVFAPMFAIKAALGNFRDGGSIINVGSIVSTMAPPNFLGYSSSKAAVDGITRVLAKELSSRKITVNQINPGSIRTEGAQKAGLTADLEAGMVATIPLGRIGFPDDIANLTAFLASDEARWITGEIIMVSGGGR